MTSDYEKMLKQAQIHGYHSFTDLQEEAFRSPDTYDETKNLFIVGSTSSGKTLIPFLLYLRAVDNAYDLNNDVPKMLFVVPYRALAAQKKEELDAFFSGRNLEIVISTGEYRQDDERIQNANVDIAVIITEKAYKYAAKDSNFLRSYDYLVLDEIGLINSSDRGVRLDFLLMWANYQNQRSKKPRIIALGTPFFDWSAYIANYGFSPVKYDDRPVDLCETEIIYDRYRINKIKGVNHSFLYPAQIIKKTKIDHSDPTSVCPFDRDRYCRLQDPYRNDPHKICPRTNQKCPKQVIMIDPDVRSAFYELILMICREHLQKGHQILVFYNDRTRIKELCAVLYHNLSSLLPVAPSADECKKQLLDECGLESDDLFGVMEYDSENGYTQDFYRAFYSGIGFHSAALPNELRRYEENKLLNSREMKIVCSTETLAFGVNSTVDVVVVAGLYKYEGTQTRLLTLNEYNNYVGRAGRLRSDADAREIKGYVYSLIKTNQSEAWEQTKQEGASPKTLYSMFHTDVETMPFSLINILPENAEDSVSEDEIIDSIKSIPQSGDISTRQLRHEITRSISFLKNHELITKPEHNYGLMAGPNTNRYYLTTFGKSLRGFIIGKKDFLKLIDATKFYSGKLFNNPDKISFLYSLLTTDHVRSGIKSLYNDSRADMELLNDFNAVDDAEPIIKKDWKEAQKVIEQYNPDGFDLSKLVPTVDDINLFFVLAALLSWCDGDSPKKLYRKFGIHHAVMYKLAEQIAFLIEITQEILEPQMSVAFLDLIHENDTTEEDRIRIEEEFLKAKDRIKDKMHKLFLSVNYGINTDIIDEILEGIMQEEAADVTDELIDLLSMKRIDPIKARRLRSLVFRFKFFSEPPQFDLTVKEERNNYIYQRNLYRDDIRRWGDPMLRFFRIKFKNKFANY